MAAPTQAPGPQVPQVLLAIRKIDGVWECAVLVQGDLHRTHTGGALPDLIQRATDEFLGIELPNDTRAMLTLNLAIPVQE